MTREYKKTVCPLDCPDSCGIIATVEDNRVTSLSGDPEHPFTNGFICRKMRTYPERVYGPDRLLYPQIRKGKKGEGRFERISWDEALQIFADKLVEVRQKHGGEAILPYQYAGNMGVLNRNAGYPLYHKLGTSRLIETICSAAAGAGWAAHLPEVPGSPPEVAESADLIVAWGINIKVTNIHFWQYVATARKRGARLLVIDPYRNETGKSADWYLRVLPGGDGALALGVLKSLLEGNALDKNMIAETTEGFSVLQEYLQRTSWHEFIRLSGVEKTTIVWLAQLLMENPKTFIRIGIGLSRNSRGAMNVRSIVSLGAALGLFEGGEGTGVLLSSKAFGGDTGKLRCPQLLEHPTRQINMAHLGHALTALNPPVHMLIVYSSNPLSVAPDGSMVRKGLMSEELFTVVHEQVKTPTAMYADLLLPATTFLENRDMYTGYGHFQLGVVDPVIAPVGEAKSNFDLFQELAATLGFTDEPFGQTLEERLTEYLVTVEGLPESYSHTDGATSTWVTSTRKRVNESIQSRWGVRFAFEVQAGPDVPSTPCLIEPEEFGDHDLRSRFPLRLITPPHRDLLNSTFGERFPNTEGSVLIHPDDAATFDIEDGCQVRITNNRGEVVREAKVTDDTQPGLVVAEGIFWQNTKAPAGINDLTSQKTTDMAAGPTFHESLVIISRIGHSCLPDKI